MNQRDRLAAVLHKTDCSCLAGPCSPKDIATDYGTHADALLARGVRVLPYMSPGDRLVIVSADVLQSVRLRTDDGRRLDVTVPEPDEYGITTPVLTAVDDEKRFVDVETLAAAFAKADVTLYQSGKWRGLHERTDAEIILAALGGEADGERVASAGTRIVSDPDLIDDAGRVRISRNDGTYEYRQKRWWES